MRTITRILVSAAAAAAILATASCTVPQLEAAPAPAVASEAHPEGIATQLVRVVDGDTIAVVPSDALPATNDAGTEHAVRVLGIDSPEMNKMSEEPAECGAAEATALLSSLVDPGDELVLVYDSRSDHTDRYGRSLAYVETDAAGDLGRAMVSAGYAEAWFPKGEPAPERYDDYVAVQEAASSAQAGAHATCVSIGR